MNLIFKKAYAVHAKTEEELLYLLYNYNVPLERYIWVQDNKEEEDFIHLYRPLKEEYFYDVKREEKLKGSTYTSKNVILQVNEPTYEISKKKMTQGVKKIRNR